MSYTELQQLLQFHIRACRDEYSKFLVAYDKSLLSAVSHHGRIVVDLTARLEKLTQETNYENQQRTTQQ